jgi:hypothetical protein
LEANILEGIILAIAAKIISGNKCEIIVLPHVAAGGRELTIDPSGATIFIGRKPPSLLGIVGSSANFIG